MRYLPTAFSSSIGVILLTATLLAGCNGTSEISAPDVRDDSSADVQLSDPLVKASETAELSDEQVALLRRVMAEVSEKRSDAATMWRATSMIYEELGSDQRSALIEAVQESQAERRQQMRRHMRQQGASGDSPKRMRIRRSDDERARGQHARGLFRGLDLTDEQQEQLSAVRAEYAEKMRDVRPNRGERPDEETRRAIRDLRQNMQEAQREILTEEQLADLEERRQEWAEQRQRRQERRGDRGERQSAAFEAMADALELTAEQQEQLAEVRSRGRSGRGAQAGMLLRLDDGNSILTGEQREMMQLHRALHAEAWRMARND